MKRIVAIALFVLASLVMAGNASAQSYKIRANIPFDFSVGRGFLPAGTYTITSDDGITVVVQNGNWHAIIFRSAVADEDRSNNNRLVFNKYGDQYFLREILCQSIHLNLELPASKMEHRARLQASLNQDKQVFIALNQ